jgi:hypothetical protein
MDPIFEEKIPRARLALLLQHFAELKEPWRVAYPLEAVMLLVTCATIASCDDFDGIVAWGASSGLFAAALRIPFRHSLRALAVQPHQLA